MTELRKGGKRKLRVKSDMGKIMDYMTQLWRRIEAKREGVPFRARKWYNYCAMLPMEVLADNSFIEIFDEKDRYIDCPSIGGEVIYNNKGKRYRYRVVDFKNESPNRDWLYDSDYINPVIEYLGKVKEERV